MSRTIHISLPENPSTGYQWQLKSKGVIVADEYSQDPYTMELIGADVTRQMKIVLDEDETELTLKLERPF